MPRSAVLLLLLAACDATDSKPADTDVIDTDAVETDVSETDAGETDAGETDDTDVVAPSFAPAGGGWWETSPAIDLDAYTSMTLTLTFRSIAGSGMDFDGAATADNAIQVWTTPGATDVPYTVPTLPSGTIADGETFSYTVEIDLTGVAATETGLAVRPQSTSAGTVGSDRAELTAQTITLTP